ncbi:hypothetical protein ACF06T_14605 [Streptomyces albidoflavus]
MKSIMRFVNWSLGLASSTVEFYAACVVCGESSPVVHSAGERQVSEVWALQHAGANPSHRSFRAYQVSAWSATPDDTVGSPPTS